MNLTISGHHLELTPAIRAYAESKLARITKRFDQVVDIRAIFSVAPSIEKEKRHKAEMSLRLKGKDVHAESIASDLYAAIDAVIDKLDKQIMKYKDKVQDYAAEKLPQELIHEDQAEPA